MINVFSMPFMWLAGRRRLSYRCIVLVVLLLVGSMFCPVSRAYTVSPQQADSVRTLFSGTLFFSTNNGDWIEQSEYSAVGRFLRAAQKYPETEIRLTGWADTTGTAAFNWQLSEKRAAAVGRYLVRKGIAADRIRIEGRGEDIAAPTSRQARRVEMRGIIPLPSRTEPNVSEVTQQTPAASERSPISSPPVSEDPEAAAGEQITSSETFTPSTGLPGRYVAVKTNLAAWAGTIMNVAADVQVGRHWSIELPVLWCPWYVSGKHAVKTFTVQPEARYWLARPGEGHFFGLHAHMGWFNVKWNADRYQDADRPLLGAGISYGYLLPFNEHWAGEFTLGAGYANLRYNTYYNIDNGARIDTRTKNYWGITRVGISIVYRFNLQK